MARLDGCSEILIWWKIFMPLSKAKLVVVAILSVQFAWDEFLRSLVYLTDTVTKVLSVGLYDFMAIQSVAQNLFTISISGF